MQVPKLPDAGETVTGGQCQFSLGGKGANQAIAASRAGSDVFFLTCLGDDSVEKEVRKILLENNLPDSGLEKIPDVETGKAFIFVDSNGENCIGVADGANTHMTRELIESHRNTLMQAELLLLQMEIPPDAISASAALFQKTEKTVILNPAPAMGFDKDVLQYVSILTPNKTELEHIAGERINSEEEMLRIMQSLMNYGPHTVIVTLGEEGVLALSHEDKIRIPSRKVRVADTTAAGDVFNGALATALTTGALLHEALDFAVAAAALSVETPGALPSIPGRKEILKFMQ